MGNSEHGAISKLGPDGGLDQVVGLEVDGGGGLVEHQHSGSPQQRPHLVLVAQDCHLLRHSQIRET